MRGEHQPDSEPASNYPPADPPLAYSHRTGLTPPKLSVMPDGVAGSTNREERVIKRDEAADGDRTAQVGEALISRP
jgi:hypothetical protein